MEIYWLKSTKKLCIALNYIEKLLIVVSDITGFVSISVFLALFIDILIVTEISSVGLKVCTITSAIEEYKFNYSKIGKTRKNSIVTIKSNTTNLNTIKVMLCNALTDWNINLYEFVLVKDVLKEYNIMNGAIKSYDNIKKGSIMNRIVL